MNDRRNRGLNGLTLMLFVIALFAILWFTNQIDQREKEISYKEFCSLIEDGEAANVLVVQNKSVPTGRVDVEVKQDVEDGSVRSLYVSDVNEIQQYLKEQGVEYEVSDVPQDNWFATAIMYSPSLLMVVAGHGPDFLDDEPPGGGRRRNTKAMNFGKSRATRLIHGECHKKVTFDQVAGLQEEKEELEGDRRFPESLRRNIFR